MAAPTTAACVKKALANPEPSTHGGRRQRSTLRPFLSSGPEDFHLGALPGRVEDWRACLGRCSCCPLSRPFVCECHNISTVPRFQPRHVERSVRSSRTALSCLLPLKGYGACRAGATFGIDHRTL